MRISIIAAMARNHVIGTESGLPWHLPRDLRYFRTRTMGKPVILGRKTLEKIGHPLPDRSNVVLTRQLGYAPDGVLVAHSLEQAVDLARREAERLGVGEVMVIGGGEVYRAFLPIADRVYLSVVGKEFEGNATFPFNLLSELPFGVSAHEEHAPDSKNPHPITFWQLDRVRDPMIPAVPIHQLTDRLGVA